MNDQEPTQSSSQMLHLNTLTEANKQKILETLEVTFSRKLRPTYFDQSFQAVLSMSSFKAVGLIRKVKNYAYLDKFAVHPDSQNQGLGRILFLKIMQQFPQLIWRARHQNIFHDVYAKHCSGFHRLSQWCVYWRGIDIDEIPAVIASVQSIPDAFF